MLDGEEEQVAVGLRGKRGRGKVPECLCCDSAEGLWFNTPHGAGQPGGPDRGAERWHLDAPAGSGDVDGNNPFPSSDSFLFTQTVFCNYLQFS